jgi:hypothetical protein
MVYVDPEQVVQGQTKWSAMHGESESPALPSFFWLVKGLALGAADS